MERCENEDEAFSCCTNSGSFLRESKKLWLIIMVALGAFLIFARVLGARRVYLFNFLGSVGTLTFHPQ